MRMTHGDARLGQLFQNTTPRSPEVFVVHSPACKICEFVDSVPRGGWYTENEHWRVGRHMATRVPGWVVAYLSRHAAGLTDRSTAELTSMGPTLADAASAIKSVLDPERVYSLMFGENVPHVHVVLVPRGKDVPAEHRSSALHLNAKLYEDPRRAEEVLCASEPHRGRRGRRVEPGSVRLLAAR